MNIHFIRRIGRDPHEGGRESSAASGCPDIWELDDGDFAVIGVDITQMKSRLPDSASCGSDEVIAKIPRKLLLEAKADIPSS